jgi:serine/threonine-protein kinase
MDGAPVRVVEPEGTARLGQILAGKYRIERWLGAGGFAEVFVATALPSGRAVAVKVLSAAFAATPGAAERFRREAELIPLVAHPNVVAIQDYGTDADGAPFMVMELLAGESLAERLAREPLPPRLVLRLGLQICEGLAAAHERGIVHRDIKPDNLFLVEGPEPGSFTVKILDLGIAKIVVGAGSAPGLTQQGTVIGTPEYMSPGAGLGGQRGAGVGHLLARLRALGGAARGDAVPGRAHDRDPGQAPGGGSGVARRPCARARRPRGRAGAAPARPGQGPRGAPGLDAGSAGRDRRAPRAFAFPASEPAPTGRVVPSRAAEPGSGDGAVTVVALESGRTDDAAVVEIRAGHVLGRPPAGRAARLQPLFLRYRRDGRENHGAHRPRGRGGLARGAAQDGSRLRLARAARLRLRQPPGPGRGRRGAADPRGGARSAPPRLSDTWRLLQVRGLDGRRFVATESCSSGEVALPALEGLQFVPSPFCHFRGAVMLYDPANRVLFTGDLGAGLADAAGLVAGSQGLEGVTLFQQIYMPSSWALATAVTRIRALEPPPVVLAPQHGALWLGDGIALLLDHLEQLPVGIDLLYAEAASPAAAERQVAVANEILDALALLVGEAQTVALVRRYASDGSFTDPFELRATREVTGFKVDPDAGLATLVRDVLDLAPPESRSVLERVVRRALDQHRITLRRPRSRSEQPAGYRQVFETTSRESRSRPPRR